MAIDMFTIKEFVKDNVRATLTVKEVAAVFKKHPSDVDRDFRNYEGMPLKKHIDHLLSENVLALISENDMMGYEIRKRLGFASDRHFYRWVKRLFGVTFTTLSERVRSSKERDAGLLSLECSAMRPVQSRASRLGKRRNNDERRRDKTMSSIGAKEKHPKLAPRKGAKI